MSRTVVNEPSGTVSPLELRTRMASTSFGSMRASGRGLRDDAEGAAEQVEVVDVGRAEIDLQRGEHVGHVDAEQLRLGAVDVEIELRRRGLEQREHLQQARRLRRPPHHGEGRGLQRLRPAAAAVLDHHAEAAGVADAVHRRRLHHEDQRFLDRRQLAEQRALNAGRGLVRIPGPVLEGIEHQEGRAGIRRVGEGRAGEADDVDRAFDARRLERDVDDPALHLVGARQRGARRQLAHHDEVAAVDLRDEAARRLAEFVEAEGDDAGIDQQHDRR